MHVCHRTRNCKSANVHTPCLWWWICIYRYRYRKLKSQFRKWACGERKNRYAIWTWTKIQKNVNQNQTEQFVPQFTVLSRNNDSPTVLINEKLLLTLRHMCGILKLDSTTTHKSVYITPNHKALIGITREFF